MAECGSQLSDTRATASEDADLRRASLVRSAGASHRCRAAAGVGRAVPYTVAGCLRSSCAFPFEASAEFGSRRRCTDRTMSIVGLTANSIDPIRNNQVAVMVVLSKKKNTLP